MQLQRYEKSALWKRTLAAQGSAGFQDVHAGARDQLRSAFQRMRDNVSQLVQQIPQDCRGLTVHDITHLDALWEMADLIAGPEYAMTPVESFVFGAAVLLHDSGMSIAAYPEGIGKIKNTLEWSDIAAAFHRQRGLEDPRDQFIANPPPEAAQEILFSTLRKLHAKHAEELVSAIWPIPGRSEGVRLLEDQVLLQAYGKSIGRIAHSHHWDLERIRSLRSSVGSASSMPPEWTLDERKVASLLRCADAAHIDERRAPTMLYALSRPTGISRIHWNFQNKQIGAHV